MTVISYQHFPHVDSLFGPVLLQQTGTIDSETVAVLLVSLHLLSPKFCTRSLNLRGGRHGLITMPTLESTSCAV